MKKTFCNILLMAAASATCCATNINIIPQPQVCEEQIGAIHINKGANMYCALSGDDRDDFLALLQASGFELNAVNNVRKANVRFLVTEKFTNPEAYGLTINRNGITVEAGTSAGMFYGLQSLLQLVHEDGNKYVFPAATISDYPRFSYRGLHLDVSRHFMTVEFIKKQIDVMARYKLNRLHWHLTDGAGWRIEIKKYPLLTEIAAWRPYPNWKAWWEGGRKYCRQTDPGAQGGYYTQEQCREVVEYARKRNITVIPEIEMPGHSEEVMAVYPEFSCTGKQGVDNEFCVGKEATFRFIEDVLTEVMDVFPSKYIHIGGDEAEKTSWKTCPDCQYRMKHMRLKDVDQLQSYLVRRVERFLNENGRKMIGWDEILDGGLSPNATVMSWRGEEGGIKAALMDHDVVMTPGAYCYFDGYQDAPHTQPIAMGGFLTLNKVYSYNPVPEMLSDKEAKRILGVQANLWTENIPTPEHTEYMLYPRLCALSEVAWTELQNKNAAAFREKALNEVEWLKAHGYHPFELKNEIGDRPSSLQPVMHLAKDKKVTYINQWSKQYAAGGETALTDGVCGGWTYGDGKWQGFIGNDFSIVIDLEQTTDITSIGLEFMQFHKSWVYMPLSVTIDVSDDGTNYTTLSKVDNDVPADKEELAFKDFGWKGTAKTRYIRVTAQKPEREGGWLFIDEVIVK